MNFLVTNSRQFLPKEKQLLIEHREKLRKYRKKITYMVIGCCIIATALIAFPGIINRTAPYVAPIYGIYKVDPVIKEAYTIKRISGKDASSIIGNNENPQIASQQQLAEIIVQPQVVEQKISNADNRVSRLYSFLISYNSPMAGSAATFIQVADKYHIDWRLLPSIAGTESGFGRVIPIQASGALSYNPFGYGVYDGTFISFHNWDEAIATVGKNLASAYGVENLKPYVMEETYCPPCYAGDHHWQRSVNQFMSEL